MNASNHCCDYCCRQSVKHSLYSSVATVIENNSGTFQRSPKGVQKKILDAGCVSITTFG